MVRTFGGSGELALDISDEDGDGTTLGVCGALPSSRRGASHRGILIHAPIKH